MTTQTRTIAALDTPTAQVEADVKRLVARQRRQAAIARLDSLAAWLVTHPDEPVSTAADYPGWTPGGVS
ncbi:hypothetical protein [Streptomyces sp. SGAir0957]